MHLIGVQPSDPDIAAEIESLPRKDGQNWGRRFKWRAHVSGKRRSGERGRGDAGQQE
jgi:hypothetical protein